MTVSTTLNKQIFPGNGATTAFSFTFAFPNGTVTQVAADLQVIFTDALGNQTTLVQGPGTTQYQLTINAPTGTNPTPAGGTVTYNPSGTPIPLGTTLTILRQLPLVQGTSIANQSTFFQPVVEAAADYQLMVSQQVLEVQSRALQVAVSDPTPSTLPAAAARAGLVLGFDSNGNPIAVSTAPAGVISSAMAPVVGAATLAAGRTAFGLGAAATLGVGVGLASSGGNLNVLPTMVTDGTSPQTLTNASAQSVHFATVPVTYNLPALASVTPGYVSYHYAFGGNLSFAPNGTDSFFGMGPGVALGVPNSATVAIRSNGTNWFIENQRYLGSQAPINFGFACSVAASALTVTVTDQFGNAPTTTSPVIYQPGTASQVSVRAITAALTITIPNGATLGTVNGQASRIWVAIFDNNGTPVLGVYNALNNPGLGSGAVVCWDESTATSGTAISGASNLPQTWYTNGAVTSKFFRVVGYFESTQPTAGAWTAAVTKSQAFGPGQKKPGDVVQEFGTISVLAQTTTSSTFVQLTNGQSLTTTPQSAANIIRIDTMGALQNTNGSQVNEIQISRGTVANTNMIGNIGINTGPAVANFASQAACAAYDAPNTNSSITYAIQGRILTAAGTLTYGGATLPTFMSIKEIFA